MKSRYTLLIITALFLVHAGSASAEGPASRIKKCKDANGTWHYGDTADAACAQSKVTEIDARGIKRKETAAPLSEAELKERERNKTRIEAEQKAVEEHARRDQLLLATYGHEDDINLARDRKLSMIDAQIVTSEATISTLRATLKRMQERAEQEQKLGKGSEQAKKEIERAQSQIKQQENYITARRQEQEQVKKTYADDLKRYLELKGKAPEPTAAAPATTPN